METVKKNKDILAWSHAEMTGINPNIACHMQNIDPNATLIRHKRRPLDPVRAEATKMKVDKLMFIKFLLESLDPVWLANLVLVPKSNGSWRICIDYTDLNKTCLKDCFSLS